MESKGFKHLVARSACFLSFLFAVVFLAAASWLFAEGPLPSIQVGENRFLAVGGVSINGYSLPDWMFYFLPTGFCVASFGLFFVGWRLVRMKYEDL
jgi:hypothetical protein